jgi:hypothetical protein
MKEQKKPLYQFATTCPKCGNQNQISAEELSPVVCCGNCLMDRCEVVNLKVRRLS